jgi:ABC-type bacteriocin/lantibiotic exporter with double-glycine peptidase domain
MEELLLFFLTFLFVLCIYEFIIVRRAKKKEKKKTKKKDREPIEVTYLVKKYKLDLKKISYDQLLQIIALTSSFDIAIVVNTILFFDNTIIGILVGFVVTIVVILVSYHLVYLFYRKKGMIKDES